jgi:hypothetical protein
MTICGRSGLSAYRQVRENLRVKEVTLEGESGVRWTVCHNPVEAERDAARRTEALTRLTAELERIKTARARHKPLTCAKAFKANLSARRLRYPGEII